MKVIRIDHVQIPIPPGGEAAARAFYGGALGLTEVPKPEPMRARGGMWFAEGIHLGIEDGMRPSVKAHPALVVSDLAALEARLRAAGCEFIEAHELPGVRRGHTRDPFGNRIELVQDVASWPRRGGRRALARRTRGTHGAAFVTKGIPMQPRMHLHTSPLADPHAGRKAGGAQDLLKMFVGRWRIDGQNSLAAPSAKGSAVRGEEVYEMLPGGFFLRGEWNHALDDGDHIGTSLIGFHPDKGSYCAHHYDNLGFAREYVLTLRDRIWRFAGRYEHATYEFSEDHKSFVQHWEISRNGLAWQPLCEMTATMIETVASTPTDREAIARQAYEAYATHDRAKLEAVIGPGLHFTSPYDDAIDRAAYFMRCWPSNERMRTIEVERVLLDGDDAAVVTYTLVTASGRRIHNSERLWFKDGQIDRVEVFFGMERDAAGAFAALCRG